MPYPGFAKNWLPSAKSERAGTWDLYFKARSARSENQAWKVGKLVYLVKHTRGLRGITPVDKTALRLVASVISSNQLG
jgi:hypothetical protein